MLSTALVTAVMCFATSGNAMLVGLLGEGYGEYGQAYRMMIFVPAAILGLMIFFMSVTVISNIFRISANQRIKQFGVLKCVGGTSSQVKESVIYESICLCYRNSIRIITWCWSWGGKYSFNRTVY